MSARIGAHTILPADREGVVLRAEDGVALVGELALPAGGKPARGLAIALHPLPTHGGSADSHLLRKASWRLPALAGIGVLRFNTRGTSSSLGTSEGEHDAGRAEERDVAAAVDFAARRGLANRWLVGWSFGAELAMRYGPRLDVAGGIALAPPMRLVDHLRPWDSPSLPLIAVVPEFDEHCPPDEVARRLRDVPSATVKVVEGAGHLWVGERSVRRVLDEVADAIVPGIAPLETSWNGPTAIYHPKRVATT
jgi:alpha/beta superfamily hydrolase